MIGWIIRCVTPGFLPLPATTVSMCPCIYLHRVSREFGSGHTTVENRWRSLPRVRRPRASIVLKVVPVTNECCLFRCPYGPILVRTGIPLFSTSNTSIYTVTRYYCFLVLVHNGHVCAICTESAGDSIIIVIVDDIIYYKILLPDTTFSTIILLLDYKILLPDTTFSTIILLYYKILLPDTTFSTIILLLDYITTCPLHIIHTYCTTTTTNNNITNNRGCEKREARISWSISVLIPERKHRVITDWN